MFGRLNFAKSTFRTLEGVVRKNTVKPWLFDIRGLPLKSLSNCRGFAVPRTPDLHFPAKRANSAKIQVAAAVRTACVLQNVPIEQRTSQSRRIL